MLKRTERTVLKVDRGLCKAIEGVTFATGILKYLEHDKNVTPKEFRAIRSKIKKQLNLVAKFATV